MVSDRIPTTTAIPDPETLIFKRDPTLPLSPADYGALLRLYLLEANSATGDFFAICDEGLMTDVARSFLPKEKDPEGREKKTAILTSINGVCVPLAIPQSAKIQPPLVHFFIAQMPPHSATIIALSHADEGRAMLGVWGEVAFFQAMEACEIPPHQALRIVHDTLYNRAAAKSNGEVLSLTRRLQLLGSKVGEFLTRRNIPWN